MGHIYFVSRVNSFAKEVLVGTVDSAKIEKEFYISFIVAYFEKKEKQF